jgi:non-ribosomal peptide synthetase component F
MSVFTAYVGLVLRWCNASEGVIQYVTDGRVSPKIENTIGFFASVLYLRIELLEDASFVNLMNLVTDEYCKAYEHADFSYMEAQVPPPEFARNSCFNWVPQGAKIELSDSGGSEGAITCSPLTFAHPMLKNLERDNEPVILLFDTDDEIVGDVCFPLNRFSIDTMERFGRNLLVFIRALLRQPDDRVKDILLS